MSNHHQEKNLLLLKLVQEAVQQDKALREKFGTGEKFRFIRDRLQSLLDDVTARVNVMQEQIERKTNPLKENEQLVYVYLYNAQGLLLSTWHKMLGEEVFYEYSINRPIYDNQNSIEAIIRNKSNKPAHAYITIAVNKNDILPSLTKDNLDQPVIKVREGALKRTRMISFSHNGNEYVLDERGTLIPKT